MTFFTPARMVRGVVLVGFLLMLSAPARAQEQSGFAKNGGYVGMSGILDFSFGGDTFDGESIYKQVDGDEIVILPKFEGAHNALRAVAGYRQGWGAFEFSFDRTKHDGTFLGRHRRRDLLRAQLRRTGLSPHRSRIQPHLLVGGSIPWMTIKDGSFLDPNSAMAATEDSA